MSGREIYLFLHTQSCTVQPVAQQPAGAAQLAPQLYTLYFRLRRPGLTARVVRAGTSKAVRRSVRFSLSDMLIDNHKHCLVCLSDCLSVHARVGLVVCGEAQAKRQLLTAGRETWRGKGRPGIYARYPPGVLHTLQWPTLTTTACHDGENGGLVAPTPFNGEKQICRRQFPVIFAPATCCHRRFSAGYSHP